MVPLNRFWTLTSPIPLLSRLTLLFSARILHHVTSVKQSASLVNEVDLAGPHPGNGTDVGMS